MRFRAAVVPERGRIEIREFEKANLEDNDIIEIGRASCRERV